MDFCRKDDKRLFVIKSKKIIKGFSGVVWNHCVKPGIGSGNRTGDTVITNIKNEIYYNGQKLLYKEKCGRKTFWFFGNGSSITTRNFIQKPIEIKCNKCGFFKKVNFYVGKNGLINRIYICMTCNKIGADNPFYGKKHSEEFKERLSSERQGWYAGEKNNMFGVNVWDTYSAERHEELLKKLSDACKGDKNGFYGKTHTEETKTLLSEKSKRYLIDHPEHLKKMIEASFRKQSKGFKSSIEKKVEGELSKRNIKFRYNKILHRKYQYDFIIGDNILLEVQGDYWHANPLYYGDGNKKRKINDRQKFKMSQDIKKRAFAEEYGYKIFYIWETEVNKKHFEVVDAIEKILKENSI